MTKDESRYLSRVVELGCIACRKMGVFDSPAGVHHIRQGIGKSQRASHYETLPLCGQHHQTGGYGVAFHAGPKVWQQTYGTERELLAEVHEMLGFKPPE